jgi:enterochelin esterase-like enzyme
MKKFFAILSFTILIYNSYSMDHNVRIMESLTLYSKILGQDVKYSISLPKDYYKGNRSYPVVYLLHGLGDDETSWLEYGCISQYADNAVKEREIIPMIFVMPQGFRSYYVNDYAGKFMYQDMIIKELIPFIDSCYRTIADKKHRAVMGYSMGGYGALILPLKNPDVFDVSVPLSISIRTDEQYMVEAAREWDEQWGRLFGGVGTTGKERITEYYMKNNPFHIFEQEDLSKLSDLKVYIDNGDDENTLCRSNEELHILLRNIGFPHEFRVRDGGHTFQYWRSALPNALRFISDAFESRPYRGDIETKPVENNIPEQQFRSLTLNDKEVVSYVPPDYDNTTRLFPVIYFAAGFSQTQRHAIAGFIKKETDNNNICPMLIVFLPEISAGQIGTTISQIEGKLRIRKGYRFRVLAGYQNEALNVCSAALFEEQFAACILSDASISKESISKLLSEINPENLKSKSFFIDAPDKGSYYDANGDAHMYLRDKDLQHEYRVREGNGGFDWFMTGLPEIISYTVKMFHK